MTFVNFREKALSAFFLFILISCSKHCAWEYEFTETACPIYESAKVYSPALSSFDGLEVEILATKTGTWMFLNVYSIPLSGSCGSSGKIEVELTIDGEPLQCEGYLYEGGQRIVLDDNTRDRIIEALLNQQSVTIAIGRYHAELDPTDFVKAYLKLQKV